MAREQDREVTRVVEREGERLRNFIRRRVPDSGDAEDVLQDVWQRFAEANRLLMPIEHVTGWLFTVARNRITDLFRRRRPERFADDGPRGEGGETLGIDEWLPSPEDGPDALAARAALLEALAAALEELPPEQRDVFLGHEIEGRSFKEMAAASGVNLNTLLARKRYAVLALRERLQDVYDAWTDA